MCSLFVPIIMAPDQLPVVLASCAGRMAEDMMKAVSSANVRFIAEWI